AQQATRAGVVDGVRPGELRQLLVDVDADDHRRAVREGGLRLLRAGDGPEAERLELRGLGPRRRPGLGQVVAVAVWHRRPRGHALRGDQLERVGDPRAVVHAAVALIVDVGGTV